MDPQDLGLPPGYQLDGNDDNNGLPPGYKIDGSAPIQNTENILQKAIKSNRSGSFPMTMAGMLPTNGAQAMDLGKNLVTNTMNPAGDNSLMQMIANMTDKSMGGTSSFANQIQRQQIHKSMEPETPFGKNVNMQAHIAPAAMLGLEGATAAAGGLNKLFSTQPFEKGMSLNNEQIFLNQEAGGQLAGESDRLGNIKDYLENRGQREVGRVNDQSKILKGEFSKQAESLAYGGKKNIASTVESQFEQARNNYKAMLDTVDPTNVGIDDLTKTLDKVIEEKNILGKEFPSRQEQELIRLRFEAAGKIPDAQPSPIINPRTNQPFEGEAPEIPKIQDATDFKAFKDKIIKAVHGRPDLEGEFLKRYGNMLQEKGLGDFLDANAQYKSSYDSYNSAKSLSKPALKRLAVGSMSSEETADLASKERGIGTDYTSRGQQLNQRYQSSQDALAKKKLDIGQRYGKSSAELGSRLGQNETAQGMAQDRIGMLEGENENLGNELQKIIGRQKFVKGAAWGTVGTSGIGWLLKHILALRGTEDPNS